MASIMRYKGEIERETFSIPNGSNNHIYVFTGVYSSPPQVVVLDEDQAVIKAITNNNVVITYPNDDGVSDRTLVVFVEPLKGLQP